MTMPITQSSSTPALPVMYPDRGVERLPLPRPQNDVRISDDGSFSIVGYVDVSSRPAQPRASRAVRLREWIYEKFPRFAAFTGIARARSEVAGAKEQLAVAKIELDANKIELYGARFDLAEMAKELDAAKRSARLSEHQLNLANNKLQMERDVTKHLTEKVATLTGLLGNGLEWDRSDLSDSGRESQEELSPHSDVKTPQAGSPVSTSSFLDAPVIVRKAVKALVA
ncbi:hypothetical protein [Bordetella sp. N]|uniref:hypothetical protein n=1 Tax=Bordetella sp. N TaxID=1746199 RepID=UPI000ABE0DCB|nr:hypothetical protein [Bordetella sp. N]